jgi:ankyrin repeat protein
MTKNDETKKMLAANGGKSGLFRVEIVLAHRDNNTEKLDALLKQEDKLLNWEELGVKLLCLSIEKSNMPMVKFLLSINVDINRSARSYLPIMYAAEQGNIEMIDYLINKGADPGKIAPSNYYALYIAVARDKLDAVKHLIAKGVKVDICSENKRTPLHIAVALAKNEIAEYLISEGADINFKSSTGKTPLIYAAIEKGTVDTIKLLIYKKADLESRNIWGATALHFAAMKGKLDIVRLLLENKANLNCRLNDGGTPLHLASEYGKVDVMKILLEHGADINARINFNSTPLHYAAANGKLEAVKLLVEKGADPFTRCSSFNTPLLMAEEDGHSEVADYLKQLKKESIPLAEAAAAGNLDKVKELISGGAGINSKNSYGETALHEACAPGRLETVKFLIENKADLEAKTNVGFTPLHTAVRSKNLELVKLLISKGCNVNALNNTSVSSMHLAAYDNSCEIIKLLHSNGAKLQHGDNDGETPLTYAAHSKENLEAVKLLVSLGHEVNMKPKPMRRTALNWAVKDKGEKTVEFLLKSGADPNFGATYHSILHEAVLAGDEKIIEMLILNGALVNALNMDMQTPMDKASDKSVQEILRAYGGKKSSELRKETEKN